MHFKKVMLLAITLAGSMPTRIAQSAPQAVPPTSLSAAFNQTNSPPAGWHSREGRYYQRNWGIDVVDVRRVSSGDMLAFRYVVLDPDKAAALNDKRNTAYLIDEKSGTKLMVPQMEKVGALRTTVTPVQGKMYWMVFANTGKVVSAGSRVSVVIGDLKIKDLVVVSR